MSIRRTDAAKVLLSFVFITLVFLPLGRMFLTMDGESIREAVSSPGFGPAVGHSLTAALLATAVTLVTAYLLAVCVERTGIRFKSFFRMVFALPMLIPSISIGMGLIILYGNNGMITRLLGLNGGIYGLGGIVLGAVLYAFPVAFLMFSDVMKYEDYTPYEAARVLGISRLRRFTAITLPYLRKPLISIAFSVFTLIVTDYGVPLMVGGKYATVPVVMYQEVIGQLNFGKGAVYGSLLLIPAVAAFLIDLANKDRGNGGYLAKPYQPENGRGGRAAAYGLCGLTAAFIALTIFSFVLLAFTASYPRDMSFTFANVLKALNLRADRYLFNSITVALLVSAIGTAAAFGTAYLSARMKSPAARFLHLSAITSAAIPGVVLGLSYVLTFKGSAVYGTLVILVMANLIHFIASPYLMMYNSLAKLNENLEGVGATLGIGRGRMIRDVFLPQCRNTLTEMFVYFFVNCMMTISAVSFLATTANKPVSLMINQFEAQMQLELAAVVSLAILAVNLLMKGAAAYVKRR